MIAARERDRLKQLQEEPATHGQVGLALVSEQWGVGVGGVRWSLTRASGLLLQVIGAENIGCCQSAGWSLKMRTAPLPQSFPI